MTKFENYFAFSQCPMYDDILNMKSSGMYDTVTKSGSVVLKVRNYISNLY